MFFDISLQNNKWKIESDPGWHQFDNIWAKGYACDRPLEQVVADYDFEQAPAIAGNFCLIKISGTTLQIGHNLERSFPLWASQNRITNLEPAGEPVWADTMISIDSTGLRRRQIGIAGALGESLTVEQVTDRILDRVTTSAQQFLKHNQLPINTFRSGGLDTAFLYALANRLAITHTEWKETVIESNDWINQNTEKLECFWAYQQIHHWNRSNMILTGSHGDEYFLRGPSVIAMIMAWHDIDFAKLLQQHPDAYHYHYFLRPKNFKLFVSEFENRAALKERYPTFQTLCDQIINILANDHQHWHLGNTLTWTPQKDLDIARWALCLPIEDLIENSLHGSLIRNCIQRLMPSAIEAVTKHKNRPNVSVP